MNYIKMHGLGAILVVGILIALIFTTFLISLNLGSFAIEPLDVIKTLLVPLLAILPKYFGLKGGWLIQPTSDLIA